VHHHNQEVIGLLVEEAVVDKQIIQIMPVVVEDQVEEVKVVLIQV
jgi:hypothetical protein